MFVGFVDAAAAAAVGAAAAAVVEVVVAVVAAAAELPIGIHDGEDVDVVEVDNVLVGVVALHQLLQDVGHRRGADPLAGVNACKESRKTKTKKV